MSLGFANPIKDYDVLYKIVLIGDSGKLLYILESIWFNFTNVAFFAF